mgnify:CR=1 FL=1
MRILTLRHHLLGVLLACLGLAGCGDEQSVTFPGRGAELFYSYPNVGQDGVSTRAPVVLRLSHPLADPLSLDTSMVNLVRDSDDAPVATDVRVADGSADRSIVLQPQQALAPGETYRVNVVALETTEGPVAIPATPMTFTTALASKGPRSVQVSDAALTLVEMFPDNDALPILDFSSLRFRFSQPLDAGTVRYGDTVELRDADGMLVPANVLASAHFLTLDPNDNLNAGESYTVTFSNQLGSRYGASLDAPFAGAYSFTFTPGNSGPTERMALIAPASGEKSVLTGDTVNLVPVIAVLLGDNTQSQQQGDVFAELAFVPNYPDATPLRIARGSTLSGDALDIRVSGEVPAGFDSGDVTVQFITDATGYLLPNPFSNAPDAPRQLRMKMDIAITTGNPVANAGFTQNVLHLELIGQAIVENGVLTTDALTVVESDVLGLETAHGVLSFRMQAYADQIGAPLPPIDVTAPSIVSWMPGDDNALKQRKGEPVIVFFNEALDPASLDGRVQVWANDIEAGDVSIRLDGAALVINSAFDYNSSYRIELLDGITDLAGNVLPATTLAFDTAEFVSAPLASPFVTTAYPGNPCRIAAGSRDLANNIAGRCDGGQAEDDRLPLARLPANRDIRVRFSQNMDRDSIILGQSFRVEQIDAAGTVLGSVDGLLTVGDRELSFMPDEPWQQDALYQYTLVSNNDATASSCTAGTMVCAANGLPLKTRLLATTPGAAPALNGGGGNLVVAFRGGAPLSSAYTQLANLPTADVNGNTLRDAAEDNAVDNPEMLKNSTRLEISSVGGTIAEANVGCPVGQSCPRDTYAYITGTLDTEVVGYLSAAEIPAVARGTVPQAVLDAGGGILVYLYPNVMMASETTVYATTTLGGLATADPAPTGPLIMRMRHQCDARSGAIPTQPNAAALPACNGHHGLVEGWIIEGVDSPEFLAILDLYLDTPALNPVIRVLGFLPQNADHNMRSYGLPGVTVRGPVAFIDDGRMEITLESQQDVFANIEISAVGGLAGGNVELRIPAGGVNLNYISAPVKR